jgi:hypothetical protein
MSETDIKAYKKKFDRDLRDIKVVLMKRKAMMHEDEWLHLIEETKKFILANPLNYLKSIPETDVLVTALDLVFCGFLKDQKIRYSQKKKLNND